MPHNSDIWEKLCKTDPAHTKRFSRAGGFKGTAIKPIWTVQRMTEVFGPCGQGWGIEKPEFSIEHTQDETLVYCTVAIWHGKREQLVYGVGGDKVRAQRGRGDSAYTICDDEAFKKSYTDAIGNALKFLGVGADVHMGLFDDSKYVTETHQEYSERKSSAQLKREGAWEEFSSAVSECDTLVKLESVKKEFREKAQKSGWNKAFMNAMADEFAGQEKIIMENQEVV